MATRVRVIAERTLANERFRLTRTRAEIEEADGVRREIDHEIYHHGAAAAILLYDPERGVMLLVRQFRLGAYLADGALATLEACAGMLDGDEPEACARREAFEETGVRIASAAVAVALLWLMASGEFDAETADMPAPEEPPPHAASAPAAWKPTIATLAFPT